jgi:histidyl-tRNA synthetase
MFQRVKGTSDNFFEMAYWNGVIKKIEGHLKRYNFNQIDIPLIEHTTLFERGLGVETDVISKQMFLIANKSETHESMCLRPEATAGTMRAFLENQNDIKLPARFFSYGSMFRYERPQKGRLREFHHFNMEIIGASSILNDAYFIKMLQVLFIEILTLEDFVLKVNFLGQPEDRAQYCQSLVATLMPLKEDLCDVCKVRLDKNPLRILDCKSQSCQDLGKKAPKLSTFFSDETKKEFQVLQETLEELSVTFIIDDQLVRGLDYYNKTVFEFVSVNLGAQNTFCGGGRYDSLAQQLGSKTEIPALGCAIGMERILMILENKKDLLSEKQPSLACIIPVDTAQNKMALHLADHLTSQGLTVEILVDDQKFKNKMKKASDLKACYALIIGEDEQKNNSVTVKNMITGSQESILQNKVAAYLKK